MNDKGFQYVDDSSQFLNPLGAGMDQELTDATVIGSSLSQIASRNCNI
jgi:hypothetical protein